MKLNKIFRALSTSKQVIDSKILSQRGNFDRRSTKELESVFKISFTDLETTKDLDLGESSLDRLPLSAQEFLVSAFTSYNNTFLPKSSLTKDFDDFKGNEASMKSIIEFFIRSLILSTYEEGVYVSTGEPIILDNGVRKGFHDLVITKGEFPCLVIRHAVQNPQAKGIPLEQAFCNNVFEVYTTYWKTPVWPLFGCISDLNSWIFIKYDGKDFYRTHKIYKLALHNTAILSLSNKILNIIDNKVL
jgi:hypothetical protein